jgi:hypothetical protein
MFGELPKLFGKSFAIGFLLPATVLGTILLGIFAEFGYSTVILPLLKDKDTFGIAVTLVVIWLLGIALMALNVPIYRLLEGYYDWNPVRWRLADQQRVFDELSRKVETSREAREEARQQRQPVNPAIQADLRMSLEQQAQTFPDRRDWVLPTKFGNRIRAFEVYSRVIYGLEAIEGWPRLLAVIPADYRQAIDEAKAQTDFWVNLWLSGMLGVVVYIALAASNRVLPATWVPIACLIGALVAANFATATVRDWGMLVMSAFDLFRGDLAKKLGLTLPSSFEEERQMWVFVSQVMEFRSKEVTDLLARYRIPAPETKGPNP